LELLSILLEIICSLIFIWRLEELVLWLRLTVVLERILIFIVVILGMILLS
jgi:hypothetical protein